MPRSMWSGAISFGLVNVPVKLYSAVSRKTVRFNQLNAETGNRIQQKRVDPETGDEVPYEQIVKGFELTKDRYVIITPDEMDALDPEKTRTVDIEDFVDLAEIDPIYYDHPYYLVPDKGAAKAYGLLLNAMEASGKVKMAQQLIDSLSSDFEPEKYRDEYRDKVLDLIERKAQGEEIAVQPEAPAPAKVPDLMAALEASLAAVKSGDDDEPAPKKKAPAKKSGGRAKAT